MPATATLCLFAKAPVRGQAKTRLAPALSAPGSAALAKAFLRDALHTWREAAPRLLVVQTGEFEPALTSEFSALPCMSQGHGSLGERLEKGLCRGLAESDAAIAVGTDIPGLGARDYQETMRLLETYDAVLGPVDDGGFCLLALRSCPTGLLRDLPWSSPDTLVRTKQRLIAAGMSVGMLDSRFDVDEPADLVPLGRYLRSHPREMPHTQSFMASSGNRAISVIIPVLNEEAKLGRLLTSLTSESKWAEIIVVDGESSDSSVAIASSFPGVQVLHSSPGRARQMNCGAAAALGGTLLFLHADAQLPPASAEEIQTVMQMGEHVAGAFRIHTRYDDQGRKRSWVRPFLRLADLRSRYSGVPYGDQALFVRAHVFRELGGYPEQPLFEDLHLSSTLARQQRLAILPGPVVVSGRRFQERPLYYLALMNSFPWLYRLGVAPRRLAKFYHSTR